MIETLTTSGALYLINRDRALMELRAQKRRAALLLCAIMACLSMAVYMWILS